jgi:hypothetical protein
MPYLPWAGEPQTLGCPEQMSLVLLSVEVNLSTCNSVVSPNCRQSMSKLEGLECEECKRLVLFEMHENSCILGRRNKTTTDKV